MAYNAIQDNLYNYYLTAYTPKSVTKYDTHKRSELRSLYNSMVKLNKESPLYLIPNARESAKLAVGIKENARVLRNQIASLGGLNESELLQKKVAYSDREDIVTAEYIGDVTNAGDGEEVPSLELSVRTLASGQTNLGNFLPSDQGIPLAEGTYSFDIGINDLNYEFQFNINNGETNLDIQNRLSRLISNAGIGLKAEVVSGEDGTSSLKIQSEAMGLKPSQNEIFTVSDYNTSKTSGVVGYLGIHFVSHQATNATFLINGEERDAYSNNFSLGKLYEVNLHGVSADDEDVATIGLKRDSESLADNISQLAGNYNNFLRAMDAYKDSRDGMDRLRGEFSGVASLYKEQLHTIGLEVQDDGHINIDEDALSAATEDDDIKDRFQVVRDMTQQLYRKTNQISLNPMKYVNKTVVAYKNPGHNFANPYVTSNYSGMMFKYYC